MKIDPLAADVLAEAIAEARAEVPFEDLGPAACDARDEEGRRYCARAFAYKCVCDRCESEAEPDGDGRFHACDLDHHLASASRAHKRIYSRPAHWCASLMP